MPRLIACLLALLLTATAHAGREFTVLVFNVENLFDVDNVALYSEYDQDPAKPHSYGVEPMLRKLDTIARVLAEINAGAGPEVILFQEIELDRTPFDSPRDPAEFLARTAGVSVRELLAGYRDARRYGADLLLLKHLHDRGLGPYQLAKPDPFRSEAHPAHVNVVFSRFPVRAVRQRDLHDARCLLEVVIDVDGHPFTLLNNHWKSGASNPESEPVRIQNAMVVRARLESILLDDPFADVLVAGDLNSHYNQTAAVRGITRSGLNDVLGSQGDEAAMLAADGPALYNLWHELPPAERGSEVWRGRWGTLMQMLLARGLYDRHGIQYVDNSFFRLAVPGLTVEPALGRPTPWTHYGGGAGCSDHLPVGARFRVVCAGPRGTFKEVANPTREAELSGWLPPVPYASVDPRTAPPAEELVALTPAERALRFGEVFRVRTPLAAVNPPRVRIGDLELVLHAFDRDLAGRLAQLQPGAALDFLGDLGEFRGQIQFVIQHPAWLLAPGEGGGKAEN
jgi:endonuclease/exonuclease/phosphatase family metal-dependent hydrolase